MWGMWQRTAASASCRHLLCSASRKRHSPRERSWPLHCTSLMWMGPRPEAERGSVLPAPCPFWSREDPHPPPDLGTLHGNRAANGRRQGSPVPVQAGGAWTSQNAPAAPTKPRTLTIKHSQNHRCPRSLPCCPPLTLAHLGSHQGLLCRPIAQLPAHHAGCSQVPLLVTHSTPLPMAQHLHTALTSMGACSQPHREHLGIGSIWSGHSHPPAPWTWVQTGSLGPAPGASIGRTGCRAMLDLTFPREVLLLSLPLPFWEAGPGRQLTMACMPWRQAC